MISFKEAYQLVLEHNMSLHTHHVSITKAHQNVLAEAVYADRDFPPFHRATKDGIAIAYKAYQAGQRSFVIEGVAAAGNPQQELNQPEGCLEVMTGAMVPTNTDTIVMYEHLEIKDSIATIVKPVREGQNIHKQGSDEPKGSLVLQKGTIITPAEIGVLASVGKYKVLVYQKPKVAVISTGNELVDVHETPQPHQIRKSNSYSIVAALDQMGIMATQYHVVDEALSVKESLAQILENYDVLLLSGGVSKGKYDYIPGALESLGVTKLFHKVKQRPGKPFWFGTSNKHKATVFAFPGNPASTFANFHVYFVPWYHKSLGIPTTFFWVQLAEAIENDLPLTRFVRTRVSLNQHQLQAHFITENGSGDLTSLTKANGFVMLEPETTYSNEELVPFIPTKPIL
ncbi:molybdopterin molybdotransferase MoeA [Croceivirga sp. JEA036]|uniref:molybdopterin molybdotransferase MoeA n=1 Tax=Croceivirga sp. JEA036 TaxID=2721162 RepID=UPI00143BBCB6|nr:molybdopterin molybdotransferase MoeA [Croceivirga sp. JEA036]NJB35638.1 molybdopterin molybdotransferase MoeA [Croceivirga sp. JEA036]